MSATPASAQVPPAGPGRADEPDRLDVALPMPAPTTRRRPVDRPAGTGTVPFAVPGSLGGRDRVATGAVAAAAVHTLLARHAGRWAGTLALRTGDRRLSLALDLPRRLPFAEAARRAGEAARRATDDTAGVGVLVDVTDGPGAAPVDRYDLVVRLRRVDGRPTGELAYPRALFTAEDAARLAARLSTLLHDADARPDAPLGGLALLPEAERCALVTPTAGTPVPERTLPELVARQAADTPDAVAVDDGTRRLTYRELVARSRALAAHLRGLGVRRGDRVGVAVPRDADLVPALLGVLWAGAAYVPLDPEHPAGRLAHILADAGVGVLVTAGPDGVRAAPGTVEVRLDRLPAAGDADAGPGPGPDDAAYVVYTSGSTGRPKGVLVTHRCLTNFLWSMRERPGLPSGAVLPAVTTVSFDIAVLELFLPLLVGGRVLVATGADARDPQRLAALLARADARVMQATPITWRLLLDAGWAPPAGFTALCGGERLPVELARRLLDAGVDLWDLYGPTETTVWSSAARLTGPAAREFAPVANTSLYVLDDDLEPVPTGAPGELYVGGRGVAAGYVGRPALTADRFLPDRYAAEPGARLYRTGDVARRRADGSLEILGRTDDQLKIRGFRIEPAEVENVLVDQPGVAAAVVGAVDDDAGDPRLVAWLRPTDPTDPPGPRALRRHCARLLPPYLVPTRFVLLDRFPTTANGKIDRSALTVPADPEADDHDDRADDAPHRSPADATERLVARVFAETLGRPVTDADADFFALGGHSLLATRAAGRLRAETGADVPVAALFDGRTVAEVARRLAAGPVPATDAPTAGPTAGPATGPAPLSFAQRGMWLLHQRDPDGSAYHEPLAIPLPAGVPADRVERVVTSVVERHEILRTRYVEADAEPVQVVDPPTPVRLRAERADLADVLAEETARPFDLAAAAPVRWRLLADPAGRHTLLVMLHHIAVDDRSARLLADEIVDGCAGRSRPAPALRYAEHARREHAAARGERAARHLDFWRRRLAGARATELPADRRRPTDRSGAGVRFEVPASVVARLDEIAAGQRATRFHVLLAGFFAVLARHSGRTDVTVGVPVSLRDRPELDDVLGLFVNTVVLRADLDRAPAFTDLVSAVRDGTLAAWAHADVPFEQVVADRAAGVDPLRNPLFTVLFTTHDEALPAGSEPPPHREVKAEQSWHLTPRPDGGLAGRVDVAAARFDPDLVAALAAGYVRALATVADAPATPVDRLAPGQPTPAVTPWPAPDDTAVTVAQLVTGRAEPDAVAVTGNGPSLTFAELDRRANRLAHRLLGLGVGPDRIVAVRLPRTPDLVVALLAVVKAGGAYLPLDPRDPGPRQARALADARPVVFLGPADERLPLPAGVRQLDPTAPAERAALRRLPDTAVPVTVDPDDLAYVVYTSGSTGQPKGVLVTHRGLTAYTRWASATLLPPGGGGSPLHTSIAYDLAVTSLFPVLAAGEPVRLLAEEPGVDALAPALAEAATGTPYAMVKLTPTHLDLLATAAPGATGGARCLVIGGEPLHGDRLASWAAQAPATRIVNSYGPSETAVACAAHVTTAVAVGDGPVPIGEPLPGVTVHLLDEALRPVPAGAVGEIHVGGCGVGRGYLGRARATADRFGPDPWAARPGARLYRTGDLARRRGDGTIEYVGRRDDQVKINGYRVEPGEAQAVLAAHPAVRAAAVVADHRDPRAPRLAAYVVPATADATPARLRAHLADRLPAHLVPTLWGIVPELPLLGSGKVDRQALPHLATPQEAGTRYEPPASPAERVIAAVWADVLGVARVGRHDRFLDLGGQSLLATRLAARLRDRLPAPVTVRDVFAAQTVAALATVVAERARALVERMFDDDGEEAEPQPSPVEVERALPRADRSGPLPLSFAQRRLWFLDQVGDGVDYLVPTALRLRGELDPDALSAALTRVVARHEVLRTRYVAGPDGEPAQVVDPPPARIALTPEDADPAAVLRAEVEIPVDLAAGPVLRARLLRVTPREHVLLLVIHHIAVDGLSMGLIAEELADAGRGVTPAPLPAQYADFAVWQRDRLTGPELDRLLDYWRQRLAGSEPTHLPADRPRPALRDAHGDLVRFTVPATVVRRLDEVGRRAGATGFMTCLTVFLTLLARHTGRTDVTVGVPTSGRTTAQVEQLVGFFVNTVVLRADLAGDPSFAGLLGRVADVAAESFAHEELPFDRLVEELAPQRDRSGNPLFDLLFAYREAGDERFALPGLDVTVEPTPTHTAKFDLTLEVTRQPDGGLTGEIEYATALFDRSTVERIAGRFGHLLAGAAEAPHLPISRLPMLDAAEHRAVVAHGHGPDRPRPDAGLPELVAEQAARTPGAVAVEYGDERMRYGDLDAAANRLARHLRAAGIGRDDVVGLCLPRRPDLVVALLGVLRAGAAFLPLDPAHPPQRQALMLRDAGARLLLTADGSPPGLAATLGAEVPTLDLTAERAQIRARAATAPDRTDPDSIAYVIYTSGSTGAPKGVAVPHRGIRNRVLWAVRRYGFGPDDRMLQKTSVSFDASVWEFLAPLVSGGAVVLAPAGAERDPATVVDLVARHRVTVLQGVPSFLRPLADEPTLDRCVSLRLLFSAGEPLADDLARRLTGRLPVTLVNTYGPTEASIDVTAWQYDDAAPAGGPVPIGAPLDNTRAFVLAGDGSVAPFGVPGELHVAGEGLARGYLGRPRLTAQRFVPDPYGPPGSRAYRTGDLARRRADGALEFLGRTDQQVKIRGVRVEPGEVETVLARHPAVSTAVVVARPGPDGQARLAAYLVTRGAPPAHTEIRAFLLARLPEPYVPSVFVPVDRMPLTTSGKVDRAALPEPGFDRRGELVAPRTPTERTVAAILAEVLGLDTVGVTDDFFELGGHSLLAIRFAGRLRAALGAAVSVRAVLEDRTVAAVAARYADRAAPAVDGGIAGAAADGPAALSHAQQRLWFLHRLDPDGTQYHVTWAVRLAGRLDPDALAAALTDVVARHDVLRTRYPAGPDGTPAQVVEPARPVRLPVTEAPPVADRVGRDDRLAALVRTLADRPFDLEAAPPVSPHLIRLGPDDHVFVLVMHHIAGDGWSDRVLARDLSAAYRSRLAGRPAALPPPAVRYADVAVWQRARLTDETVTAEVAFWRERLAGLSPLALPTDLPRPPVRDGRGATVDARLPAEVARPLLAVGRRCGATPFVTFLAVFAALLGRHAGTVDVPIGTVVAGRHRPELEDLVGLLVNTVVLRVDLDDDPDLTTLLGRVRRHAGDAFAHDELPFDRLVEELAPPRDLSRSPLCDVMMVVDDAAGDGLRLAGLRADRLDTGRRTAKFDLTLTLTAEPDGGYRLELEYATALFGADTARRMAAQFGVLAAGAAAAPGTPVGRLPLLGEREGRELARRWNPPAEPVDRECLHEAFAAQVRRTPDAVAVESPAGRLTYAELERQATALAHRLRGAGVAPERPVAVLLDRSLAVPVVLFAVLRAGGVYVPLGTGQPPERLAVLLRDLRPAAVVAGKRVADRIDVDGTPVVVVGETGSAEDAASGDLPGDLPAGDPDRLAYMIYTSGSTGRPKAVMVPHASYTHHCRMIAEVSELRDTDRAVLLSALTFDLAMEQLGAILLVGGTVVISDAQFWAPSELPDRFAAAGITHVLLTPAYYREVMAGVRHRDPRLSRLRLVHVGGEVVTHEDARLWHAAQLPGRFVCAYGPTEATIVSLTHPVSAAEVTPGRTPLPIGRPVPGTRAYVLDDDLRPVPTGFVGELCLGGERVSRGYHDRPRLTADRFVPDPFGELPGQRLYRTGDHVRQAADGTVEFVGRVDGQVKLRGLRIELGEIEAALATHPEVRAAAAAVHGDDGDRRLVAYVVPHAGATPSPALLRRHLADRVPDYMLPGAWVTLDRLPLNASKKVDRAALPPPSAADVDDSAAEVAPRTEVEQAIAGAWAQVLGLPSVGVEHDFFAVGGHSLLATRLLARLRDLFGLEIPLRALFEATTVSAQAAMLERLAESLDGDNGSTDAGMGVSGA
ncbi:non-ribosomal peptide synthetase [Micromonospora sp. WMMD975]|uniref:non-ribosomal peptide synthetase n=1 Tax=Micromonospora sp. WMMD975 TaxID=3016087 RepID=UPI00249B8D90|nr:non-ribosomal peptide synthetase [Micromonospora sp. WMMD975]WFE36500.1 amino acid adenylation domain-containing protein [Micromonospora sp. WMMD975]